MAEIKIGPHLFRLSGDGICALDLNGLFTGPEAREFVREIHAYQEHHPKVALLVVMTHAKSVAPEARKIIIAGVREKPYGVCFVQANFALKALVSLMLNAVRLLGEPLPHAFVDSEERGRTWAKGALAEWDGKK